MDLYEVKATSCRGPLNAREISQLFRAGLLHPNVPCKPKGEARWRTIDELFPLLKYRGEGYSLPADEPASKTGGLGAAAVAGIVVVAAFIGVAFVAIKHF